MTWSGPDTMLGVLLTSPHSLLSAYLFCPETLVARLDSEQVDTDRFIRSLQARRASTTYRDHIWRDILFVPIIFPLSVLSFVDTRDI